MNGWKGRGEREMDEIHKVQKKQKINEYNRK
jgi:hypothetical protein